MSSEKSTKAIPKAFILIITNLLNTT